MHKPKSVVSLFTQSSITIFLLSLFIAFHVNAANTIAFVGASFTAGAGSSLTAQKPTSKFLELLRYNNSIDIRNFSPVLESEFFPIINHFKLLKNYYKLLQIMSYPVYSLKQQIHSATQLHPEMIITIDGLFWVVYSSSKGVLDRLEEALNAMSESGQNYVISFLPYTTISLLSLTYKVPPELIDKVNKRLKLWSLSQNESNSKQGKILLLDLDLNSYFGQGSSFDCGNSLGVKPITEVRSGDRLHPTEFGYLCLAEKLLAALSHSPLSQFNFISSYFDINKISPLAKKALKKGGF